MRIKVLLVALLSFWVSFSYAQKIEVAEVNEVKVEAKTESSLLWEITGNGLEKPSYLFGTIHIIAEEDYFWTDLMEEKFQQTELLVLEIDIQNPMMMMMSMMGDMMMKDGNTLKKLLTEEQYKEVDSYFSNNIGIPVGIFNRIKPVFTSTIVSQMGEGEGSGMSMEGSKSYEMELIEKAEEREIAVEGLETVEYQMSIFDSIPYAEQAEMLMQAINGEGDSSEDSMAEMIELYKKQDLEGLYKMISGSDDLGDYEDVLLVTRNKNWIPKINEFSKEKSTFIAVGAGHLPGENGVINLLKKEGYTLKPLK